MELYGLNYFISAARHLNFTKAAEECCITQTAMSLHISKLERELQFSLFYRNNRKVMLTPAGEVFLEEARKIVSEYALGVERAQNAALGYEGTLKIGYPNYLERASLPLLIKRFHQRYPKIKLELNRGSQWSLLNEVREGNCDIVMILPYELEDDHAICLEQVSSFPICLAVSKQHPLAAHSAIPVRLLQEETMIIVSSEKLPRVNRRMWDDWGRHGFKPRAVVEADSLDTILLMVEAEVGVALIPSHLKELLEHHLAFIDLEDVPFILDVSLSFTCVNKNPALQLFLNVLTEFRSRSLMTS